MWQHKKITEGDCIVNRAETKWHPLQQPLPEFEYNESKAVHGFLACRFQHDNLRDATSAFLFLSETSIENMIEPVYVFA